jgi:hypothetical protein
MEFALIGAAVVVTGFATPALSPVVVEYAGYRAQFYLNEKWQNRGVGGRYADGIYYSQRSGAGGRA